MPKERQRTLSPILHFPTNLSSFRGRASIITEKCLTLKDDIIGIIHTDFFNLKIERDGKVNVNGYNKKNNVFILVNLLIKNI